MKNAYDIGALAASQAGFFSTDQAEERGMSRGAIRWGIDQGFLVSIRSGLYRVKGIEGDHNGRVRAALAILPNATASHESAAELLRIPFIPRGRAVVTVHAKTTHDFPGVVVHRSLDMQPSHRSLISGLETTTLPRTIIDLAAVFSRARIERVLDELLASGATRIEEINQVFHDVSRQGRKGCGSLRALLEERIGDELVAASKLERVGMQLFERGGLPRPIWQYPAPWNDEERIDFAWPEWWCGVEGDGRRWHTRASDFERDRRRDRLSLLNQWMILRFTWHDFVDRPDDVLTQVRSMIEARRLRQA